MSEDQNQETTDGPVSSFIRENKIGIAVVAVLIAGVTIFSAVSGPNDTEPTAVPTVSSTAQLGPGGASPSATDSPKPNASSSPTETPEASESPSAEASDDASAPAGGTPNNPPGTGNTAQNIPDSKHAPKLQDWEENAEKFAVEWADTAGGKESWLKRIEPLVTEDLYESFTYTDIRALYDDKFDKIRIDEQQASYIIYTAFYEENGPLFQGLIQVQADGSWLVKNVGLPPE